MRPVEYRSHGVPLESYERTPADLPDGTAARGVVVVADDRLARRSGDYERFVDTLTHQDDRVYADAHAGKTSAADRGRCSITSPPNPGCGRLPQWFPVLTSRVHG